MVASGLDQLLLGEIMRTFKTVLTGALVLSLFGSYSTYAADQAKDHVIKGHEFAGQAKVSLEQARRIALKAYPGKITDEELEKERGGSGLRYSFDIRKGSVTHEVGVDAKTGKVLENSKEGPNAD